MGLQFLHSALLWGLALTAVPVFIHLLRRRLVRRYRLPTFEFLLRTQKRIANRSRLRNWLLLALRVGAVMVAVFLAARPLLETEGSIAAGLWSPLHLVVVLDNSASMSYLTPKGTRFELAKRAAERLIRDLSSSGRATVLTTAGEEEAGKVMLKEDAIVRLAHIRQTDARGNGPGALQRALESFSASADRRSVVVFSDFSRNDWEALQLRVFRRFTPNTQFQFVRVAPEAGTGQVLLREVSMKPWPPQASAPFTIVVHVANHGERRREKIPVRLYVGDVEAASSELTLEAGAEGAVNFRVRAPQKGALLGRVELGDGAFPAASRHFFAAQMGGRLRVLLVDGDPRQGLHDSETFYLASALRAASPGEDSPMLVQVAADYELDKVRWKDYQIVIACNVGNWPPRALNELRAFVEGGGGLLVASGDVALRTVPGGGWLPALVGEPRQMDALQRPIPMPGAMTHPAFSMLEGLNQRLIEQVRLRALVPLTPVRGGKTLLTLQDGTPILVVGTAGAGRVAMWASTCDRGWTDLPVRPVFVPLIRGLVDFLGGRELGDVSLLEAGEPMVVRAPASRAGETVQVRLPNGGEANLRMERSSGIKTPAFGERSRSAGAYARFGSTYHAGLYRVLTPEGDWPVAVNVPAVEADIEPLDDAALRERMPGVDLEIRTMPATLEEAEVPVTGRADLGLFLLVALAGLFLAEAFVADRS